MNREVHVRIWERPEVRVLWVTRRLEPVDGVRANGRQRRLSSVTPRPRERPLTEAIADNPEDKAVDNRYDTAFPRRLS
jgi:hypothetical protein